ncbi:HD domain-containing protein [Aliamphritea spongicola]|uniref:HD domain-containing protein n=1 Tax=Aliamphritea spongicola TaxID=707589 RepID=UPI00196A5E37|nr:HD domain-containing protein [Aliamphritea spongicola]MBN3562094.1 HD domain-containing protein [Aliamphritea spongicola]
MNQQPVTDFEAQFATFIQAEMTTDTAHDFNHVLRVVKTARQLCAAEQAQAEVVMPAAWLHDCFTYPKDHPQRRLSSQQAADKACRFLQEIGYPQVWHDAIHHAIVAHSFSAGIPAETLEAQIVQDADRLDSLGAVGIVRTLQVGTGLQRALYQPDDPFCESRAPDDSQFTLDHFYTKLLRLADTMNTAAARAEARRRTDYMEGFLQQLHSEIST